MTIADRQYGNMGNKDENRKIGFPQHLILLSFFFCCDKVDIFDTIIILLQFHRQLFTNHSAETWQKHKVMHHFQNLSVYASYVVQNLPGLRGTLLKTLCSLYFRLLISEDCLTVRINNGKDK